MDAAEQAGILLGHGVGNVVVTFFGGVWLGFSLLASKDFSWWVAALFAVCFVGLYAGSVRLILRGKKLRAQGPSRRQMPAVVRKQFLWTGVGEVSGIVGVIMVCNWLRAYEYIVPGIAGIVGLHFLPLARIFRARIEYVTGGAIIACCVLSCGFLEGVELGVVAAAATGIILWLRAAYGLILARGLVAAMPSEHIPSAVSE